jgi:acetolactate synthase-1/2/3 large subunit
MRSMNGADALLRSLEAEGVETVFGIPGGAILPTYDAPSRGSPRSGTCSPPRAGRRPHGSRASRRASDASESPRTPPGRGATNMVTPIRRRLDGLDAARLRDGAGAVASASARRLPGVRHRRITIPIVKHSRIVPDVGELRMRSRPHSTVASTGRSRGQCSVDIPRDIQECELEFAYPDEVDLPPPRAGGLPQASTRSRCGRQRRRSPSAQRPVLYVGGGAVNAEACDELRRVAELWQATGRDGR